MATRKTEAEVKVERITWFLLVAVIALLNIFPDAPVPKWAAPLAGAVVLLGSGAYQYFQRWRVSPTTWIAGTALLGLAVMAWYLPNFAFNYTGIMLLIFAGVILMGVITGET